MSVVSFLLDLVFLLFNSWCIFVFIPLRSVLFYTHLLQFVSLAAHLCNGVQFSAPQNLHGRFPVVLIFGLVPNFSILCIGSSSIVCLSFVEISASGIVFFWFFFSYVFRFLNWIVFSIFQCFFHHFHNVFFHHFVL